MKKFLDAARIVLVSVVFLGGCQAIREPELELGYWQLKTLDGAPVDTAPGEPRPEILFDSGPPQRVSGFNGCNRFAGAYVLAGVNVEFRALSTTRMACAPAAMGLEQHFSRALDATRGWRMVDADLELLDTYGQPLARFELKQP